MSSVALLATLNKCENMVIVLRVSTLALHWYRLRVEERRSQQVAWGALCGWVAHPCLLSLSSSVLWLVSPLLLPCPSTKKRKKERLVLEHNFPGARTSYRWPNSSLGGWRSLGSNHLSVVHWKISGAAAGDIKLQFCLCQSQQCDLGQGINLWA